MNPHWMPLYLEKVSARGRAIENLPPLRRAALSQHCNAFDRRSGAARATA